MLSPSIPSASMSRNAASAIRRSLNRCGTLAPFRRRCTVTGHADCTVYGMSVRRTGSREGAVWRTRGYRRLWSSVGISLLGSEITVIALPLAAVAVLDASAGQVALLAAAGTAPFLLLGLP